MPHTETPPPLRDHGGTDMPGCSFGNWYCVGVRRADGGKVILASCATQAKAKRLAGLFAEHLESYRTIYVEQARGR